MICIHITGSSENNPCDFEDYQKFPDGTPEEWIEESVAEIIYEFYDTDDLDDVTYDWHYISKSEYEEHI